MKMVVQAVWLVFLQLHAILFCHKYRAYSTRLDDAPRDDRRFFHANDTVSASKTITINGANVTLTTLLATADDVAHPNYNVPPGITFTIRCNVPDPSLEKNVAWYFEDQLLEPRDCGDRLSTNSCISVDDASLKIYNIRDVDTGLYRCDVATSTDNLTALMYIRVFVEIEFTRQLPSAVSVDTCTDLVVACNATGYPPPQIGWSKNNVSVSSWTYLSGSLHLAHVHHTDGGWYVCHARNQYSSRMQSTYVVVKTPPEKVDLKLLSVKEREMTVGWHVSDDGGCVITSFTFYYVMYKATANGSVVPAPIKMSATTNQTTVKGLHEGVQYIVVVKANNRLGSSRRAVLVVRTLGTSKSTPMNNAHPVNASEAFERLQHYRLQKLLVHHTVHWLGVSGLIFIMVCCALLLALYYRKSCTYQKAITRLRVRGDSESSDVLNQMYAIRARSRPWSFINPAFQEEGGNDCGHQPIVGSHDSAK